MQCAGRGNLLKVFYFGGAVQNFSWQIFLGGSFCEEGKGKETYKAIAVKRIVVEPNVDEQQNGKELNLDPKGHEIHPGNLNTHRGNQPSCQVLYPCLSSPVWGYPFRLKREHLWPTGPFHPQ